MSQVRFQQSIGIGATADVNLNPFQQAGRRGAQVAVAATCPAANSGEVLLTLMAGSDILIQDGPISGEAVAGQGPTNESPRVGGIAAPADPLTLRLRNTGAGAVVINGIVEVTNA